jgi:hypothetical protein
MINTLEFGFFFLLRSTSVASFLNRCLYIYLFSCISSTPPPSSPGPPTYIFSYLCLILYSSLCLYLYRYRPLLLPAPPYPSYIYILKQQLSSQQINIA